jgi:hypothetical protein
LVALGDPQIAPRADIADVALAGEFEGLDPA